MTTTTRKKDKNKELEKNVYMCVYVPVRACLRGKKTDNRREKEI